VLLVRAYPVCVRCNEELVFGLCSFPHPSPRMAEGNTTTVTPSTMAPTMAPPVDDNWFTRDHIIILACCLGGAVVILLLLIVIRLATLKKPRKLFGVTYLGEDGNRHTQPPYDPDAASDSGSDVAADKRSNKSASQRGTGEPPGVVVTQPDHGSSRSGSVVPLEPPTLDDVRPRPMSTSVLIPPVQTDQRASTESAPPIITTGRPSAKASHSGSRRASIAEPPTQQQAASAAQSHGEL
jgi:hypothetical protein